jgi:hypothetical protein
MMRPMVAPRTKQKRGSVSVLFFFSHHLLRLILCGILLSLYKYYDAYIRRPDQPTTTNEQRLFCNDTLVAVLMSEKKNLYFFLNGLGNREREREREYV